MKSNKTRAFFTPTAKADLNRASIIFLAMCLCMPIISSASTTSETANQSKLKIDNIDFASLIFDAEGKLSYIVTLNDNATLPYQEGSLSNDGLPDWQKPEMRRLAADMSQQYGFKVNGVTSWIRNSIFAFLTTQQVQALLNDPRVESITPNQRIDHQEVGTGSNVDFSNNFTGVSNEPNSTDDMQLTAAPIGWNISYMGGPVSLPANPTTVYVVDSGVGLHYNLPSVRSISPFPGSNPVGCYPHSAHVAGIIAGNGYLGRYGLYPNAPLVSITRFVNDPSACTSNPEALLQALDQVKREVTVAGKMGVVNMSINATGNLRSEVNSRIANLVLPDPKQGYKGVVFIQSAGNTKAGDYTDACAYTYNTQNDYDGVLVVGALDINGQPVVPLNGVNGSRHANPFDTADEEQGTRYGPCVDIWAPGKDIYSAWGNILHEDIYGKWFTQSRYVTSDKFAYLSGTSMAAPHIAALAAYMIDQYGLTTPGEVEQKIRSFMRPLGTPNYSRNGYSLNQTIYTARLGGGAPPMSKPTVEFAFKNVARSQVQSGEISPRNGIGNVNVINGAITVPYMAQQVILSFDSIGAQSCTVTRYMNNVSLGVISSTLFGQLFAGTPSVGTHRWDASCTGSGQTNTASTTVTVTSAPLPEACANTMPILTSRYSNPVRGHDTYMTTDPATHNTALSIGYYAIPNTARLPKTQVAGSVTFKRFYNYDLHNHFSTYDATEIAYVLNNSWKDDGAVGFIYTNQQAGTVPLHRLWMGYTPSDSEHRYTIDQAEVNSLRQQGWSYDGIKGYVCPN